MALIICSECGKEYSNKATSCPNCGCPTEIALDELNESITKELNGAKGESILSVNEIVEDAEEDREEKPIGSKKKRIAIISICAALVLLGAFAIYLFGSPKTVPWCCIHKTNEATCTEAKVCSRCGKIYEEALGHEWVEATCTEPQTCSVCQEIYGEALGHNWIDATCTEPQTCSVCQEIYGEALGHRWKEATCTAPKTCEVCHVTEGEPKDHYWIAATCTDKKRCSVCGKTEGQALGHNVKDYVCTRCKKTIVSTSDIPNIIALTKADMKKNSVGGVSVFLDIVNKSKTKTIKYVTITLVFYNAVNDVLKDDVTGRKSVTGTYTGPIKPGKKAEMAAGPVFYNKSAVIFIPTSVEIEYTDGTKLALDGYDKIAAMIQL